MHTRQGHERRQFLQELYGRELDTGGAIGPGVAEGVEEVAVGITLQALQGHRAAGGIAEQPLQLIAAMGGDQRVGMQRKAMHTGTASTGQGGAFAFVAKARANTPHLLPSTPT